MPVSALEGRLRNGWGIKEALETPDLMENVFLLTRSNTSGVRGVSWDATNQKWVAAFRHKKVNYFLGRFNSIEDAAEAIKQKRYALDTG